jgi:SpoVK/Ycf46/Vps4 family AAA+-type ATPase
MNCNSDLIEDVKESYIAGESYEGEEFDECTNNDKYIGGPIAVDFTAKSASQWSDMDGKIIAVSNTFSKLDPGYYTIGYNNQLGMYFQKENVQLNKLYRLPNKATDIILNDIEKFWKLEEKYKKYNRVFRRNYLLYSAPGTGKTSLINIMCKDLIEQYGGVVISLSSEQEIQLFVDAIRRIRKIEPDRKIIAVIEDIDNFIGNEGKRTSIDTYLLNILDGNMKTSGVVTIATTNYIDKVEARYKNRPSRFNKVVEFPLPNKESREMFIKCSILPEDLERIDLNKWVKETEGFTIDHINELIQLVLVFDEDEDESFALIKDMVDNYSKLKNSTSVNKRKIGFSE